MDNESTENKVSDSQPEKSTHLTLNDLVCSIKMKRYMGIPNQKKGQDYLILGCNMLSIALVFRLSIVFAIG